ncbi:hypothetical protein HPP92_028644 [Vanilla planifolia]|uniref:Uncharacterized protein n=1 Tax=Vanilla planifolia TaxID=51239 RepID=A0A835P794_VANPL|nr:hypothetical protein HPP92_028644 [Vanilla planifolia]
MGRPKRMAEIKKVGESSCGGLRDEWKKVIKNIEVTEVVDDDATIGEAAGGAVGVEVAAVGETVGAGEGAEEVVGAGVDGGVAEDEECRGEGGGKEGRRAASTATERKGRNQWRRQVGEGERRRRDREKDEDGGRAGGV